jgi:hypothetical protein
MTRKEWQRLNERLAEQAMEHETNQLWESAGACWVALADLREEEDAGPLRTRASQNWQRAAC